MKFKYCLTFNLLISSGEITTLLLMAAGVSTLTMPPGVGNSLKRGSATDSTTSLLLPSRSRFCNKKQFFEFTTFLNFSCKIGEENKKWTHQQAEVWSQGVLFQMMMLWKGLLVPRVHHQRVRVAVRGDSEAFLRSSELARPHKSLLFRVTLLSLYTTTSALRPKMERMSNYIFSK